GLDENAFAGLTVSVRRAERGRLSSRVDARGEGRGGERHLDGGPDPEPEQHPGDRYDRSGVEDRSRLPRENVDERGTRGRLEIAARIDEIDDGDLDRVAPLTIETG